MMKFSQLIITFVVLQFCIFAYSSQSDCLQRQKVVTNKVWTRVFFAYSEKDIANGNFVASQLHHEAVIPRYFEVYRNHAEVPGGYTVREGIKGKYRSLEEATSCFLSGLKR